MATEQKVGIFRQLYLNGVQPAMPPRERKGIIFNNFTILFYFLSFIAGALYLYYLVGISTLFWFVSIMAFSFIPMYVLNGSGFYATSTLLTTLLGASGIFISAAFVGEDAGVQYFYIALAYTMFMNSLGSRKMNLVQLGIIITAIFLLYYIDFDIGYHLEIPSHYRDEQRLFALISVFTLVALMSYNFRTFFDDSISKSDRYFKDRERLKGITESQTKNIQEKEELLRAIYDNTEAGIILESPENNLILDVNEKAERIFRRFKSDLVGSKSNELLAGLTTKQLEEVLHSLEERSRWSGETSIRSSNGKEKWVLLSLLHFSSGGENYRLWNIRDINNLKKAQEELEHKNNELDSFVYSMAHDLKGPLGTLSSLISNEIAEPEEQAEMQHQLIRRMRNYIDDVVNITKDKKLDVEIKELNLKDLIEDIRTELKYFGNAEKVDLKMDFKDSFGLRSDPYRLKVIMQNLLSNAVNYADFKKPESFVKVSARQKEDKVILEVTDNGKGISESDQAGIFKMFYKGEDLNSGSGLGLFLVKQNVDKLNGELELKSTQGEGSSFIISLPQKA